ncbi:MAG: hypothetical protein OHK0022_15120 [Roseiflexaceae bacterium]
MTDLDLMRATAGFSRAWVIITMPSMGEQTGRTRPRWLLLIPLLLLGAVLALLWLRPGLLDGLGQVLSAESIATLAAYLRGFGAWTPLASVGLMVAASVVAPLPGSLLVAANGVVFGLWWGALISWTGGLLGATASFWIARLLGQPAVARLAGAAPPGWLERVGRADGFWVLLAARLVPVISFDLISYVAGLSSMRYPRFLLATAVGMLPGTLAWTALGYDLLLAREATWRLGLVALLAVAGLLIGRWRLKRGAGG